VLDFGLAKLTDRGPASNMGDNTQTIADAPLTVEGSIIGTVSYMSPEQAQGKKVDTRSDIFSFGVVLYEMLTGSRAFNGDSALSTLSAILRDEHKPMVELVSDVPPQLEMLITRCLRKNPDERWQSMKDVLAALGALKHDSDSGQLYRSRLQSVQMSPRTPPAKKKSALPLIVGLVGLLLLIAGGAAGGWWWMKHRVAPAPAAGPVAAPVVVEVPVPAPPVAVPTPVETPPAEAVLNNDSIIEMVTSKVPVSVILSQMRASKTDFVLTSAEVIRLSKAGVPGPVIEAMRDPKKIPAPPADAKKTTVAAAKPTVTAPPVSLTPPVSQPISNAKMTTAPPVPVPPKAPAPATVPVNVTDAMPFSIKLAEDVPADAEEGHALHFIAIDGLKVGDAVVIAKGAAVTGLVLEAGKRKTFGGNKMTFRLLQVEAVDGKKLSIRSEPSRGKDGPAKRPIDAGAKGKTKEVAAAAGSQYVAYIEGEQTVSVHKP
jgi:serine/threonine-protein kinase